MDLLATTLRAAQFAAHAAHNLVEGKTFHEDHAFFGAAYDAYTEAFDDLTERIIGKGEETADILQWNKDAAEQAAECEDCTDPEAVYRTLDKLEGEIQDKVEEYVGDGVDSGVENLLQGIADASQKRQYKIQQRLGGKSIAKKAKQTTKAPKDFDLDK